MIIDLRGLDQESRTWHGFAYEDILAAVEDVEDEAAAQGAPNQYMLECAGGILRDIRDQIRGVVREPETGEIEEEPEP